MDISANSFWDLTESEVIWMALIILAALGDPPVFILVLMMDAYDPCPIYFIKTYSSK